MLHGTLRHTKRSPRYSSNFFALALERGRGPSGGFWRRTRALNPQQDLLEVRAVQDLPASKRTPLLPPVSSHCIRGRGPEHGIGRGLFGAWLRDATHRHTPAFTEAARGAQ